MSTKSVSKPKGIRQRSTVPAEERRPKVAELLLGGLTQRQIAAELGIANGTVANDVAAIRKGWRDQATAIIDEAFERDLLRIEAAIAAIWKMVIGKTKDAAGELKPPNLWAVDRLVILLNRKASMLGYDAPARVVIRDLRSMAADEGIDAEDVLAEANRILAAAR